MALPSRRRPARPTTALWAVLIVALLAGCIATDPAPADAGELAAADDPEPSGPAELVLAVSLDARYVDPFAPPTLIATVRPTEAPATNQTVHLVWSDDTGPDALTEPIGLTAGATTMVTAEYPLPTTTPYGPHDHTLTVTADANGTQPIARAAITVVRWAPVTIVANASEEHASDQNVFHTRHDVPFAPWLDETAYDALVRAADTYGFSTRLPYDDALESYFVEAINGTEFVWDVDGVVSRNWMILENGTLADAAVDDILPQPFDEIEFRYVRCVGATCEDT